MSAQLIHRTQSSSSSRKCCTNASVRVPVQFLLTRLHIWEQFLWDHISQKWLGPACIAQEEQELRIPNPIVVRYHSCHTTILWRLDLLKKTCKLQRLRVTMTSQTIWIGLQPFWILRWITFRCYFMLNPFANWDYDCQMFSLTISYWAAGSRKTFWVWLQPFWFSEVNHIWILLCIIMPCIMLNPFRNRDHDCQTFSPAGSGGSLFLQPDWVAGSLDSRWEKSSRYHLISSARMGLVPLPFSEKGCESQPFSKKWLWRPE